MKNQFPEFYRPTAEEVSNKFKECIFIFDTNVLLNLYRYTKESRDNLIHVLQAIKERVWLPHQVGLEYQRNRVEVLLTQLGLSAKLEGMIDTTIENVEKLKRSSFFTVNALIEPVKNDLDDIKLKLQEKKEPKPDLMTGDPVFDAINDIFDGKVGEPYKQEEYLEIYKKGKERYDANIPPGYMDKSKNPSDTDQYGDLLVWFQIIDYAKSSARPIILVTDDAKEDWWREIRNEKLGPRLELLREYLTETGGNKWFYMYSTEQFLKHSIEYLDMKVTLEAIKEAEGIEKEDAEQEKIRMNVVDFEDAELYKNTLEILENKASILDRLKRDHDISDSAYNRYINDINNSASSIERYKIDSNITDSILEKYKRDMSIGTGVLERFKRDANITDSILERFRRDKDITDSILERHKRDMSISAGVLERFKRDANISDSVLDRFKRDKDITDSALKGIEKDDP